MTGISLTRQVAPYAFSYSHPSLGMRLRRALFNAQAQCGSPTGPIAPS